MKVDLYERISMWGVGLMLVVFFASTAIAALTKSVHPPSHIETIDPAKVMADPRFAPPGVSTDTRGRLHARVVGLTFAWLPAEMTVPAGTPVTFHVTAIDVQHGFQIVRTNGQAQILPGYVSQFTTQFEEGEYLILCNEYCGVGHHTMAGRLHVVPAAQWKGAPLREVNDLVGAGGAVTDTNDSGMVAAPAAAPTARASAANGLIVAHIRVAVLAFAVASAMAMMQALSRANLELPYRSAQMYYMSVTAHGVLMALVFTTFFIMAFGYATVQQDNGTLKWPRVAPWAFGVCVAGTLMATWAILTFKASVLYTFYPPLQAHPLFYIGLTLVVVGSWWWAVEVIASWRDTRRASAGRPVSLALHATAANAMLWLLCTVGIAAEMLFQTIPWSLGLVDKIDPLLARTLFWLTGHPLVYFWILPAYTVWYTVLPREAGGKLFSEPLGRVVFALFLILSTPVGFHHQFQDPGISASWKLFHTFNTMVISFPSLVTAFTICASLEVAGRLRGGKGLFGWIRTLPWGNPLVSSVLLAMLLFLIGGFGGSVNAAYALNGVVHNTAWIHGHFHLTVGTAAALTFMGACYWLVPKISGRELELAPLAKVQPYLWFLGMLLFAVQSHIAGLLGLPRRIFATTAYGVGELQGSWQMLSRVSALGGIVLFVSAGFFVLVMVFTLLGGKRRALEPIVWAESLGMPAEGYRAGVWDRLGLWFAVAAVLVVVAYAMPLWDILQLPRYGSPGFKPF